MQIQLNMLRSFHFVFIIIYLLYDRIYHFKTMIDIISHGMCHVHCFCKLSYEVLNDTKETTFITKS